MLEACYDQIRIYLSMICTNTFYVVTLAVRFLPTTFFTLTIRSFANETARYGLMENELLPIDKRPTEFILYENPITFTSTAVCMEAAT